MRESYPAFQIAKLPLAVLFLATALPFNAAGQPQLTSPIFTHQLPTVVVSAQAEDNLSGTAELSEETLEALPDKDGSLNEALAVLPGIQLPDDYRNSTQGGEIRPPEISISGGRPYDNLISIDGISVSSHLDPASSNKLNADALLGASSALTLSSAIIEELTIYRYNIPARFGGFSGGVIDASTITPSGVFSGGVSYQTTEDAWTEFFVAEEDKDDFYSSRSAALQPRFRKHRLEIDLEAPASEHSALLASYVLNRSEIPLSHFGESKEQRRQSDNLLLKHTTPLGSHTHHTLSSVFTRYIEKSFRKDTYASDQIFGSEGLAIASKFSHLRNDYAFELQTGFKYQQDKREGPSSLYSWDVTPSKPWGADFGTTNSKEGGYGDLYREGLAVEIHPNISKRFDLSNSSHLTTFGIQHSWDRAEQKRPEDVFFYYSAYDPINDPADTTIIDCSLDPVGCIDGEQQFSRRWIYPASQSEVSINQVGIYLEHQLDWSRVMLRPGLRYSLDDFQNNTNLAPRLAVTFDLLNDGNTLLIAGANRYYSETLLSYKLREYIEPIRMQARSTTQPSAWPQLDSYTELNTTLTHYSDLKTPYSDEYAAAIDQGLFGGRLRLEFIRRDGFDEFSKEKTEELPDGHKYYELNNNGRSRHQEYSISYARDARRWSLLLNATYQETSTSNLDYDETFDAEASTEQVFFEGEVIPKWQLPREDFNRPLTGNLILAFKLPYGFSFTNATRYLGRYQDLEKVTPTPVDLPADAVEAWEVTEREDSWVTDWSVAWETATWKQQTLTLRVDALNVFNDKYRLTDEDSDYSLGRQFWAGLSYSF